MSDRPRKPVPDDEDPMVSSLYHQTPQEKPRPELDTKILAASRRAVRSRPRVAGPFSGRWTVPVSIAAVLMISVILVPLLRQGSDGPPEVPARRSVPVPAPAETTHLSPETVAPSRERDAGKALAPGADDAASPPVAAPRSERAVPLEALRKSEPGSPYAPALTDQAMPQAEVRVDDSSSAARRLHEIERLMQTGDMARARAMLEAFVRDYPDSPVPPAIQSLLKD
ncbi:MAG: hypothetical protein LJE91_17090 [Gammaproteobacteria bacterium]|nr:hypothetical protein [Gammaproteobacteria bacterium]